MSEAEVEETRELAFRAMVERGLQDSDAARVVSNEEMAHRIRSLAKQSSCDTP
jgi:predicted transcriptional regulator